MKKIAIVMAGGFGAKLWPRSTEKKPKQFVHLIGEGTLIQNTVSRLLPLFQPEDIYVVCPENYRELVYNQITVIPEDNAIFEPFQKNTAACIGLTMSALNKKIEDDTMVVCFPADHVIYNIREFHHSLEIAMKVAYERKGILTIGITPTRPETAYGYIQIKEERGDLGLLYDNGVRYTTTFAEKPDADTAKRFYDSGDFLWNSGIFIWRSDVFWKEFEKYLPEHFRLFSLIKKVAGKEIFREAVADAYNQLESVSVDYAILEKASNVYVVEASFTWSDVSSWDEIFRLSLKDARNNVIMGDVIAINTSNSLALSDGRLIGMVDVDNLVVIDSSDALLICKKGKTQNVQEIVDYLRRKQIYRYL